MRGPQNLKKSPTCFDKTAVCTHSVKSSGRFFQIFVDFSEKLNFNEAVIACCMNYIALTVTTSKTLILRLHDAKSDQIARGSFFLPSHPAMHWNWYLKIIVCRLSVSLSILFSEPPSSAGRGGGKEGCNWAWWQLTSHALYYNLP